MEFFIISVQQIEEAQILHDPPDAKKKGSLTSSAFQTTTVARSACNMAQ